MPKSLDSEWSNGQFLATIKSQERSNLTVDIKPLKAQTFDDFVSAQLADRMVRTKGILNKSTLKKGIWIEQTAVVKDGDKLIQILFAFYQDPVSNQQLQMVLTNPWGEYSSELQQLVMQLQQSANFEMQ